MLAMLSLLFSSPVPDGRVMATPESTDHNFIKFSDVGVGNVCGQLNVLSVFASMVNDKSNPAVSPILRTEKNFELTAQFLDELSALRAILSNTEVDVTTTNDNVIEWANAIQNKYHFDGYKMSPSKALNPGVSSAELKTNPSKYKQLPSFFMETLEQMCKRMKEVGAVLNTLESDIYLLQEIGVANKTGQSLSLDSIMEELAKSKKIFGVVLPERPVVADGDSSCAVILYAQSAYERIENEKTIAITKALRTVLLSLFGMDDTTKCNVTVLREKKTGKLRLLANLHAAYKPEPKQAPYLKIRELLTAIPGLTIGGDFNLQVAQKEYIEKVMGEGIAGDVISTPETQNPTMDGVFVNQAPLDDSSLDGVLEAIKTISANKS